LSTLSNIKMKMFVCLFAVLAVASAVPAHLSTGTSTQTRSQDAAGNYAFSYNEQHATGGSSRSESGNPWGSVGSYSLNVGDGRQRVVKYVADGAGFRAAISTNEPGTAAKAPASVSISAPGAIVAPVAVAAAAPIAAYAAPAYAAPAYAAPAYAAPAYAAAPVLAAPAYGPAYAAAPALYAAPALAKVAYAPAVSAYSSVVNHAAPLALKSYAAPILAGPAKLW
jgi:hypothetical protein